MALDIDFSFSFAFPVFATLLIAANSDEYTVYSVQRTSYVHLSNNQLDFFSTARISFCFVNGIYLLREADNWKEKLGKEFFFVFPQKCEHIAFIEIK